MKKAALLAAALAMVLSWLESAIPLSAAAPGMKLGLPNLAIIFALYRLGLREAASVSLARVILVSATFGNAYSLAYSLAGAALCAGMWNHVSRVDAMSVGMAAVVIIRALAAHYHWNLPKSKL